MRGNAVGPTTTVDSTLYLGRPTYVEVLQTVIKLYCIYFNARFFIFFKNYI